MNKIKYILGIDEAGRGCLAGPVYVAAALFEAKYHNEKIKDSKLLNEKKRQEVYNIIKNDSIWYQFYYLPNLVIDDIGISRSIYLLMNKLYEEIKFLFPDLLIYTIIDGNYNPINKPDTSSQIKADRNVLAVSAASIIAKVERDIYMKSISNYFPQYSFSRHKGYGTKLHIREIINSGPSIIHRKSFILSDKAISYAFN